MLPDSSVASQSASACLRSAPGRVSLRLFPSHSDRARLPCRRNLRVPRVRKTELLEVEMMTELVAEGAQECAKRRDLLPNRRPHRYPKQHRVGRVVAEEFECPTLTGA
jgi:hypothetical protein